MWKSNAYSQMIHSECKAERLSTMPSKLTAAMSDLLGLDTLACACAIIIMKKVAQQLSDKKMKSPHNELIFL